MKCLHLRLSLQCQKCGESLPVNRAAETMLCVRCFENAETTAALWQFLVTPRLAQAFNMQEHEESRAKGLHASIGSYDITFGRKRPQCSACGEEWQISDLLALEKKGIQFQCEGCDAEVSIRKPPEWFSAIVPHACLLVGETSAEAQRMRFKREEAVTIHCYHCGASLPLDGKLRGVLCTYCGKQCMVPDDIWLRLHPVETTQTWYVIVNANESAVILPEEISSFIDLAAISSSDTALLWEDHNGYCVGRLGPDGFFKWIQPDLACSSYARIFYTASAETVWILDHDEEIVFAFDAQTGKERRRAENEDHESDTISVLDHRGAAACADNTILIYRNWEAGPSKSDISEQIRKAGPYVLTQAELDALNEVPRLAEIRRFDSKCKRIPLWQGRKDDELDHNIVEWNSLHDQPALLPDNAMLEAASDGTLYAIEPRLAIAVRFDSNGKRMALVRPVQKEISSITDCAIDSNGSVIVAFEHRKQINRETWMHIGRISLDGRFDIIAGPHAPKNNCSLGTSTLRLSMDRDRNIHVCGGNFGNLRRITPDGATVWRSVWTIIKDPDEAEELSDARHGKK